MIRVIDCFASSPLSSAITNGDMLRASNKPTESRINAGVVRIICSQKSGAKTFLKNQWPVSERIKLT